MSPLGKDPLSENFVIIMDAFKLLHKAGEQEKANFNFSGCNLISIVPLSDRDSSLEL